MTSTLATSKVGNGGFKGSAKRKWLLLIAQSQWLATNWLLQWLAHVWHINASLMYIMGAGEGQQGMKRLWPRLCIQGKTHVSSILFFLRQIFTTIHQKKIPVQLIQRIFFVEKMSQSHMYTMDKTYQLKVWIHYMNFLQISSRLKQSIAGYNFCRTPVPSAHRLYETMICWEQ